MHPRIVHASDTPSRATRPAVATTDAGAIARTHAGPRTRAAHPTRTGLAIVAATAAMVGAPALADVAVRVSTGQVPVRPGELTDVDITVVNNGPDDLENVTVRLTYPENVASQSGGVFGLSCPGGICDTGETADFFLAELPEGTGRTLTLPLRVLSNAPAGAEINFDLVVIDDGQIVATDSDLTVVDPNRDQSLAVGRSVEPVRPGEHSDITIAWGSREGADLSFNARVVMPLPAGATVTNISAGGSIVGAAIEWPLGFVLPGTSGEVGFRLVADTSLAEGSIVPLTASFEDDRGERVRHESDVRVEERVLLNLAIAPGATPARPGALLDYQIVVTNPAPFDLNDVRVVTEFPEGIAGISWSGCPGGICDPQEQIFTQLGTLEAFSSRVVNIPLRIDPSHPDGALVELQVLAASDQPGLAETSAILRVEDDRDLELVIAESQDPVSPGEELTYTLRWGQREAGGRASDGRLEFRLAPGTTFESATGDPTVDGDLVTWMLPPIGPGSHGVERLTVAVADATPLGISLPAAARFSFDDQELRTQVVGAVEETNPIGIIASISPNPIRPGEIMDLDVVVSNRSSFDRTDVVVAVEMPQQISSISASQFGGSCPGGICDQTETITFSLSELLAESGRHFSIPLRVAANTPNGTVIPIEARVSTGQGERRMAVDSLAVDAGRELDLVMIEEDDPVETVGHNTYTLHWGLDDLADPIAAGQLRFEPPAGTTIDVISGDGVVENGGVTWSLGALGPGAAGSRRVSVALDGSAVAGTADGARATFSDATDVVRTVSAQETTRYEHPAPFDVEVTALALRANPGATFDVRIEFTNRTAFDLNGAVLTLEYPPGINSISSSSIPGSCPGGICDTGERLTIGLPLLVAGETWTGIIPVTVRTDWPRGAVIPFRISSRNTPTSRRADDGHAMVVAFVDDYDAATNADLNDDGSVDILDLLTVLSNWGPCDDPDGCFTDPSGDGIVEINDLLTVLANWG
ncbi:MAG: hypothetical protein AB8G96_04850 [Phycisphaerales bacterium]